MLIAKSAIEEYVNREMRDYRYLKAKSTLWLFGALAKVGFYTSKKRLPSLKCQLVGTYIALKHASSFLYFYDPGLGKSKLALDIFASLRKERKVRRGLILVDTLTNMYNFAEQVKLHAPQFRSVVLSGSSKERQELLETEKARLYIINYAGLVYLLSTRQADKKQPKKKRQVLDKAAAREFADNFDFVAFDEIQCCKDKGSVTHKACYELSKRIPYRYGFTGTPIGRDPIGMWAIYKLIDHGETLGKYLGLYRAAFFEQIVHPYFGWVKWKFNRREYEQWYRLVRNKALSYEDAEVHDLPKLFRIKVLIPFAPEAKTYYDAAVKLFRPLVGKGIGNAIKIKMSYMALRQLATGYLRDGDKFVDLPCLKLEWIKDKLPTLPEGDKIVIFHDFIHSGDRIEALLKKMKVKYARIYGGTKDKRAELRKFNNTPKCMVLLANDRSGGTGLNLQIANRVIFYELPTSAIRFRQASKRCHRTGQKKRTYIYYLVTTGTVEVGQLAYLKSGMDILRALIQGRHKL